MSNVTAADLNRWRKLLDKVEEFLEVASGVIVKEQDGPPTTQLVLKDARAAAKQLEDELLEKWTDAVIAEAR